MMPPDVKLTEILESYFGVEAGRDDSLLPELQTEHLTSGEWLFGDEQSLLTLFQAISRQVKIKIKVNAIP